MLTTQQAADKLNVSQQRVRALLANGQLAGEKIGRTWMVSEHSVNRRLRGKPQTGRPARATGDYRRKEPDVAAAHRIYDEAQEVLFGCCSASFLSQARSDEEQEFWIRASDILLQQKQRKLIEEGVY